MLKLAALLLWTVPLLAAQKPPAEIPTLEKPAAEKPVEFVCPMDPDVRAKGPGKCSKCGMALEPGIPTLVEYPVKIQTRPAVVRPGRPVELRFEILDPKKGERVRQFQVVHEKLFHVFLVGQDLEYFAHLHPEQGRDGIFRLPAVLPKPGMYRVLSDFYPAGGAPQMVVKTLLTAGSQPSAAPQLSTDLSPKRAENIDVELVTEPPQPLAGKKTLLFFRIKPAEGLEPYLGAWGHLLTASHDLIDFIHEHPFLADGGPQVQFNVIFPREGMYRVWVQFQRQGTVNTVAFTLPVSKLR